MSRTKVVAANWKMNLNLSEGEKLLADIQSGLPEVLPCEVIIAPPLTNLHHLAGKMANTGIMPSAQNCHFAASGAFTGEVSVDMIKSIGALYCIAGHSERRQLFNENNEVIKAKVDAILKGGLTPIFCCGEALDIREAGKQNDYVRRQLEESVFHLAPGEFEKIIIAYEPIWAIGTGVTASPQQAQEMHSFIRQTIRDKYGATIGDAMRILYGGSIKGDNAGTLFSQLDVDGGLVGGASLQAAGFLDIIRAAC